MVILRGWRQYVTGRLAARRLSPPLVVGPPGLAVALQGGKRRRCREPHKSHEPHEPQVKTWGYMLAPSGREMGDLDGSYPEVAFRSRSGVRIPEDSA